MKSFAFLAAISLMGSAFAYEATITKGQMSPDLNTLLEKASTDTGVTFGAADFQLIEDRALATSNYKMYVQMSSGVPVAKTAVRFWSHPVTNELILAEMHLDEKAKSGESLLKAKFARAKFSAGALKSKQLLNSINFMVENQVEKHQTDAKVISMKSKDQWENGDLVRVVEVRSRRGLHTITVSLLQNRVIKNEYREFPQSERVTLKANIFPIYEEVEGTGEKLPFEVKELRYIDTKIQDAGEDPMGGLGNASFPESKYSPLLAETPAGELQGLWSEASLRKKVEAMTAKLPVRLNTLETGLLLQGKYATINLHPAVKEAFKDINFALVPTTHHMLSWVNTGAGYEARPLAGFAGKEISSQEEVLNNIPFRHPEHDTVSYINSGFDELQVYYAVTALMESLVDMGFTDKELSEKPFHAFLYDPDIGMRDNAYYYDNTINFTTYSPESLNYARDNSTIWHELGHAVMERLMGANLAFEGAGGYGGLSEGMADFVASLVVEHQTDGKPFPGKNNFRIVNETGFYLTNEFHDEGEAYGGVMNDMLMTAISYEGKVGLHAFTDLTLETMRLTRNHPALSAASWFKHMLYADQLGSEVRAPGKFASIITEALKARNFSFGAGFQAAKMKITFNGTELTADSPASREKPITECGKDGVVAYDLNLTLTAGDAKFIDFPATVKVEYKKGALQGALKWEGEAQNPEVYTINSENETIVLPVRASTTCESVNQPDGSCKDYAYVQIYTKGTAKPIAKKRFYLRIDPTACSGK